MSVPHQIVCMYVPSEDGGHALYSQQLLTALAAASPETRFELVSAENLDPQFDSSTYRVHRLLPALRARSSFPNKLAWATSRLKYYLQREEVFLSWLETRPDIAIVHLQEWKAWLMPRVVRRIRSMGKRVFCTVHNIYLHRYPPGIPRSIVDGRVRKGALLSDGLFVHTPQLAAELAGFLGERHPPIHVVLHGVWERPKQLHESPLAARMSQKKLLFYGVLRRNKGLHVLLRAMRQLPEFSLTIAGEAQEPEYFDRECLPMIRQLQKDGAKVDLQLGRVSESDTAELFRTHSALMLPYDSSFVAQSGVVFLAIAHGVPVVASKAGGLGWLMGEFSIGEICAQATPEELAAAVRRLFDRPCITELDRELKEAARTYSWESTAAKTLDAYRSCESRSEVYA